jgi:CubicO group peptidase (beta-lactamase class C family)
LVDPAQAQRFGKTIALLVVRGGQLVVERYAANVAPEATQRSWSMAKSVLHALVGLLVGDGVLDVDAPAPEPAWQAAGDPRAVITLDDLLRMVDGLDFVENDPASGRIDVVDMIGGSGKTDTAAYAGSRRLLHPPGTVFNYSSGSSIIVAAIAGRAVGGGREGMEGFMRTRLFEPIGIRSALPRFDAAGTFLGSSYLFATPRDFARFGLLYLRRGVWDGRRLLPEGWADHARAATPASGGAYGAHWWLDVGGPNAFCAKGYQGQYIVVAPERDLVVVRLGVSSEPQRVHVHEMLAEIVACFPTLSREER